VNSTAGIDALLAGASLFVVQLPSLNSPIPYVDLQAATGIHDSSELRAHLTAILDKPLADSEALHQHPEEFFRAYLGPLDGKASERIAMVIEDLIET
jgi:hypothetical protein